MEWHWWNCACRWRGFGGNAPNKLMAVLKVRGWACEHPCRRHGQQLVLVLTTEAHQKRRVGVSYRKWHGRLSENGWFFNHKRTSAWLKMEWALDWKWNGRLTENGRVPDLKREFSWSAMSQQFVSVFQSRRGSAWGFVSNIFFRNYC